MAQENSFDIVSKVEIQEVRNAIDQALKEIRQRFDLKDSNSEVKLAEGDKEIQLASDGEYHLDAVKEILGQKLVKRGVSLKNCRPLLPSCAARIWAWSCSLPTTARTERLLHPTWEPSGYRKDKNAARMGHPRDQGSTRTGEI